MATKSIVISMYRDMLRSATGFKDYNFRRYAIRRVQEEFRSNATVSAESVPALLEAGASEAAMLKRQSIINAMYSQHSSVMHSYAAPK